GAVGGVGGGEGGELTLDEDHVEVAAEIEGLYLAPLMALVAVGDEGHGHFALTQPGEGLLHAWEEAHGLPAASGVIFGDGEGESLVGRAQTHEAVCHDLAPRAQHVGPLAPVPLGIVPEPAAGEPDRPYEARAVDAYRGRYGVAGRRPALVRAARVVEERVVEIHEEGLHAFHSSTPPEQSSSVGSRSTRRVFMLPGAPRRAP